MKIEERYTGTLDIIGADKIIDWLKQLLAKKSFKGQRAYIQFGSDKTGSFLKSKLKNQGYKVFELVGQSISLGADREKLQRHQAYINSDDYKGGQAKFKSAEGELAEIIDDRGVNLLRQNVGGSHRVYFICEPTDGDNFTEVDRSTLIDWLKNLEREEPGSLASDGLIMIGAKEARPNPYAQGGSMMPLNLNKITYMKIGGNTIGNMDDSIPHR